VEPGSAQRQHAHTCQETAVDRFVGTSVFAVETLELARKVLDGEGPAIALVRYRGLKQYEHAGATVARHMLDAPRPPAHSARSAPLGEESADLEFDVDASRTRRSTFRNSRLPSTTAEPRVCGSARSPV
jgi:hypothetical protein